MTPASHPPLTIASRSLRARGRLMLIIEILVAYVPAWRLVRTNDLVTMVTASRAVTPLQMELPSAAERELTLRLGRAVMRTLAVLPTDSRCLIRALVLSRLLARRGIGSTMVIGVRHDPHFLAHAWVERDAEAVLPAGRFERLFEC
jgi:transglutaminase superfamily protein